MKKLLWMAAAATLAGGIMGADLAAVPATRPGTATTPAATAPDTAAAQQVNIPKALADRMDEWVGLLKAGKNRELIESMSSPQMLAQMKDERTYLNTTMPTSMPAPGTHFNRMVEAFGRGRAKMLLTALEAAQHQTPALSEEGTKAVFPDDPQRRVPALRFKKIGDTWYLDGH